MRDDVFVVRQPQTVGLYVAVTSTHTKNATQNQAENYLQPQNYNQTGLTKKKNIYCPREPLVTFQSRFICIYVQGDPANSKTYVSNYIMW